MNSLECINTEIGRLIHHFEMGELSEAERDEFEVHLLECAFCAAEVERMFPVTEAVVANREAILHGLAEDGITFDALREQLIAETRTAKTKGLLATIGGRLMSLQEMWKRPAARWATLGASTGVALLAVMIYVVAVPQQSSEVRRYVPILSFQALPYEGSLTLRGESVAKGQEAFDAGMQAYLGADYKQATRLLKRAVGLTPDRAEWWLYLGVCGYLQRDPDPAIKALTRADELGQGSTRLKARWFLAQSQLLAGDRNAAETLLEWVIAQNKEYSKEAFALLSDLRRTGAVGQAQDNGLNIVSPQGGELYLTGSEIAVSWNDANSELAKQYQVWLSTDGGVTFPKLLVSGIPSTQTDWVWKNTEVSGDRICLRVHAVRQETAEENVMTKPFNITVPPMVTVKTPKSGDRWRFGVSHSISWATVGTAPMNFSLELYKIEKPDTTLVESLVSALPGTVSSWTWKDTTAALQAPDASAHFRVKVVGTFTGGEVAAWSAGDFAVAAMAVVKVDSFIHADGKWFMGEEVPMSWETSEEGANGFNIELCTSPTSEGRNLVQNLPSNARSWAWPHAEPLGDYLVRVIAHYPEGDVVGYSPQRLVVDPRHASDPLATKPLVSKDGALESTGLVQNYPNPFNATTTIDFDLKESGSVRLLVFNSLGQTVSKLVDGEMPSGHHSVQFDGRQLASGVYVYRLEAGGASTQKRMMLTK